MPLLTDLRFEISRKNVYRMLKYAPGRTKPTKAVEDLINNLIKEAYELSRPAAVFEDLKIVSRKSGEITAEKSLIIKSESVSALLGDAEKVTVFGCTIGKDIIEKIEGLMRSDEAAQAAILDVIGSEAVEGLANTVNDLINKRAAKAGYKTVKRFSPGYGDWDIRDQRKICEILNLSRLGIELTESFLMIPEKSITAIVGWVKR